MVFMQFMRAPLLEHVPLLRHLDDGDGDDGMNGGSALALNKDLVYFIRTMFYLPILMILCGGVTVKTYDWPLILVSVNGPLLRPGFVFFP